MNKPIDVLHQFEVIEGYWEPKIIGELNGQHIKIAKFKGEFAWHKHENEDEFFYVIDGCFEMQLKDQNHKVKKGEFIIVPKGTEHRPVAYEEAKVMMFEPAGTLNTGNLINEFTITNPEKL